MRFVDDDAIVFGEGIDLGDCVDGEHGVIRDDDVDLAGFLAGEFGETLHAVWAARGTEAFLGADRNVAPSGIADTGVKVIAVAGVGFLGPVVQAGDLFS